MLPEHADMRWRYAYVIIDNMFIIDLRLCTLVALVYLIGYITYLNLNNTCSRDSSRIPYLIPVQHFSFELKSVGYTPYIRENNKLSLLTDPIVHA